MTHQRHLEDPLWKSQKYLKRSLKRFLFCLSHWEDISEKICWYVYLIRIIYLVAVMMNNFVIFDNLSWGWRNMIRDFESARLWKSQAKVTLFGEFRFLLLIASIGAYYLHDVQAHLDLHHVNVVEIFAYASTHLEVMLLH